MSSLHDGVGEQFAEVFHLLDSLELRIYFGSSLDIGVSRTVSDVMADLFATGAPDILLAFDLQALLLISHVIVLLVLALVLAALASKLVLSSLAATPPHLAAVVTLMLPTAPVEVLLFIVLFAAVLAGLQTRVEFTFALDQLRDSCLGLFFLYG